VLSIYNAVAFDRNAVFASVGWAEMLQEHGSHGRVFRRAGIGIVLVTNNK
jgi:hypothetical protein